MTGNAQVRTRLRAGRKRVVADRARILSAARDLGERDGWKAVTIRALAETLHYTAPILYEHFEDKRDVLTHLAKEGFEALDAELSRDPLPAGEARILEMVERYWGFVLAHPQWYRLMNGMDGVPLDATLLGELAQGVCRRSREAVGAWLDAQGAPGADLDATVDEIWAYLHGMAVLHLDRGVPFERARIRSGSLKLLLGTRALLRGEFTPHGADDAPQGRTH